MRRPERTKSVGESRLARRTEFVGESRLARRTELVDWYATHEAAASGLKEALLDLYSLGVGV